LVDTHSSKVAILGKIIDCKPNIAIQGNTMPEYNLEKFFRRRLIMDMKTMQRLCKGRSKRSLFRDLNSIGYLSSYSHAGRFYTLRGIPRFDNYGLWHYEQVSFSQNGTLKSTIHFLVENAKTGWTHRELRDLLRIRVQNALNDLTKNELINRQRVNKVFLYISVKKESALIQISKREETFESVHKSYPLAPEITIEVLLELIHSSNWHPKIISKHLQAKGVPVAETDVEQVLTRYNLKKTTLGRLRL